MQTLTINIDKKLTLNPNFYRIEKIINLTKEAFIIRMPKSRFNYKAGQHISLSISGNYQSREYSIYSGENDNYFEILVKEVSGGHFSPKLKNLKSGDMVEIHGPFGKFGIDEKKLKTHKHVFIASGTGIAPFHSMVKSYPELNYQMIHGVRYAEESYEANEYNPECFELCTSRDNKGTFSGRVTDYLKQTNFETNTVFYLCGNSDMIFDAMDILKNKDFSRDEVNCEVYF